ncbi:MAG: SGNH/GDSL hydrolase family protein [Nannocystales bacterium]
MNNTKIAFRTVAASFLAAVTLSAPAAADAAPLPVPSDSPILVLGASYAEGKLPLDDMLQGPFGGSSVGFGSYMDLGDALSRQGMFVVNEAQAGATATDRTMCLDTFCLSVGWLGYSAQLSKALARVAIPDPTDPATVVAYNAQYVYFGIVNDCMHSGAAGIPQLDSSPCGEAEVDAFVDEVIEAATEAMDVGLVPIFPKYPDYDDIDLSIQAGATGLTWYANEAQWNLLADRWRERIAEDLPDAIVVDAWANMNTLPDGLHPTPRSAKKAAKRIIRAIDEYEAGA